MIGIATEFIPFSPPTIVPTMVKRERILCRVLANETPGKHGQGTCSLTILKNVLCLVLQIDLYFAAFECNTTSDWLNHTV